MSDSSANLSDPWLGRLLGDHDRYRLEAYLGEGGMGTVFLATDTRIGKSVAIKLLKGASTIAMGLDFKRRFEQECTICAALKSEHIVQVSDYSITSEGHPFYVMEYLNGQTLEQLLKVELRLSVQRTIQIAIQVCAGLQLAHTGVVIRGRSLESEKLGESEKRIKVVHRDLKPANIFLVPTALGELVKVIDFGIAKIRALQAETMFAPNVFLGTFHYASPEQFDGGEIDERADIYNLGVILYEMLTGVDPFGFDFRKHTVTGDTWLAAHLFRAPQQLRSQPNSELLSPELEAIVMCCLEKSASDRFASVTALSLALQGLALQASPDFSQQEPAVTRKSIASHSLKTFSSVSSTPHPRRKFITILSAAGFGCGSVVAWGIAKQWFNPSPESPPVASTASASPGAKSPIELRTFDFDVVTVNAQGQIINHRAAQAQSFTENLGNGIFLEMVAIPGGSVLMGSSDTEPGRDKDESPQHRVTVPTFSFSKFTITQKQWRSIARLPPIDQNLSEDPSQFKGENHPVEKVSWLEAIEFCKRLSQKTGRAYRLASEAEWEYACRAGTTTPFHFGETITSDLANFDGANPYASAPKGIYRKQTTEVGSFPPNAFGLYDMHGNVWEWCLDHWHNDYNDAPMDGSAWLSNDDKANRLLRGGSAGNSAKRCRSATRFSPNQNGINYRGADVGVRVVCVDLGA